MRKLLMPFGLKPKIIDPNAPRYADIYSRSVAMAIDLLPFLALFATPIDYLMGMTYQAFGAVPPNPNGIATAQQFFHAMWEIRYPWLLNNLMVFALFAIPYVGCQIILGTTPGRWLLGLKIVLSANHEQTPGRAAYAMRYAAYLLSVSSLLLGVLWAVFNKERRTWHDMVAGTVVLNTRHSGWLIDQVKNRLKAKKVKSTSASVEESVGKPPAE